MFRLKGNQATQRKGGWRKQGGVLWLFSWVAVGVLAFPRRVVNVILNEVPESARPKCCAWAFSPKATETSDSMMKPR